LLDEHPAVFMGKPKEIRFFNGPHADDVAWYRAHFEAARHEQVVGEATPWYLHDPVAIDRMEEVVPDARVIVILRDPVDRTYSHYWMERIRGRADSSFEEFIDTSDVLSVSLYADHLAYLAEHYQHDQILVVFHDDLDRAPQALYRKVCEFLEVDPSYAPAALGNTVNQYVEFRSLKVRNFAKMMPSSVGALRRIIDRFNTRTTASYPPMAPETRERLEAYYEAPNAELVRWLGRDLPGWSTPSDGVS
jgi:hypothetical protein